MLPYCPALLSIQCCCFYRLLCGKIYDDDDDDDDDNGVLMEVDAGTILSSLQFLDILRIHPPTGRLKTSQSRPRIKALLQTAWIKLFLHFNRLARQRSCSALFGRHFELDVFISTLHSISSCDDHLQDCRLLSSKSLLVSKTFHH